MYSIYISLGNGDQVFLRSFQVNLYIHINTGMGRQTKKKKKNIIIIIYFIIIICIIQIKYTCNYILD